MVHEKFTLSKLVNTQSRPNKQQFQQKLKDFQAEIKECHDLISTLKPVKIPDQKRADQQELKSKFRELLDEKKLKQQRKETLKKEFMMLKKKQKPVGKNLQELENSVQDILSIKEQERVLNQISQMKQQQREQLAINQKMDTLNKEMSEIDIKQLDEKLDQIKVNLTEISDELKSTIDQRNEINDKKKEVFAKLDVLKKEKDEVYKKFVESEKVYYEQRKLELEKEKSKELLEKAELELEDAKITAFSAEISLCEALISHFSAYRGKKLVLDLDSIEKISFLGLEFPKTVKQLPKLLEDLELKKKEFQENSEKQTNLNLEKAQQKLEKLQSELKADE